MRELYDLTGEPNFINFKGSKFQKKGQTSLKSKQINKIKERLTNEFIEIESFIDEIYPKNSGMCLTKYEDHMSLYSIEIPANQSQKPSNNTASNNQPRHSIELFQSYDDTIFPCLTLVHLYPDAFPKVQVDRGAIKHVLTGADVMVPGLLSAGGNVPESLVPGQIVAIYAQDKPNALAVGILLLSLEQMKINSKGLGIKNIHFLGDRLWKMITQAAT